MSRKAVRTGCMRKDDSVCKGTKNPIKPPQHKDRQGIWKQEWPHFVKSNGHKVCAIHREATRRDQRRRQIGQGEGNKNAGRDHGQGDDAAKEEVKEVEEEM